MKKLIVMSALSLIGTAIFAQTPSATPKPNQQSEKMTSETKPKADKPALAEAKPVKKVRSKKPVAHAGAAETHAKAKTVKEIKASPEKK